VSGIPCAYYVRIDDRSHAASPADLSLRLSAILRLVYLLRRPDRLPAQLPALPTDSATTGAEFRIE
jgi:hypothetical protein